MARRLIKNRTVDNIRAVASEWLDGMSARELRKAIMDIHLNDFCDEIEQRTNGNVLMWPSSKHHGCLVCNNGAITVRYDNQTGKFVEVEHDETRTSEAYEILRVLNYE